MSSAARTPPSRILVVRLGALGDIVHTIPAVAALRAAFPGAQIDWLVEDRHRPIVDLVTAIDHVVALPGRGVSGWLAAAGALRRQRYDVALDLQGLMKSAVLARMSGARRVIGFSIWHLREKGARPFYSETGEGSAAHVIQKNLALLDVLGVRDATVRFPLADVRSAALAAVRAAAQGPYVLINPGAAWPNKRWPAERFGEIAAFVRDVHGWPSFVLWGPGEEALAAAVVQASSTAAQLAPPTTVPDLLALSRDASLMVSGDTGPLHIAAAAGTPTVALFGPTDPQRNGPWDPADSSVSRYDTCGCHYERRCRQAGWCLETIAAGEVAAAVQQRLGSARHA